MILTIIFGTIGLILIGFWKWALAIVGIAVILFFASILSKNITIKGYSIQKLLHKINEILIDPSGKFTDEIILAPGINKIKIVAEDVRGDIS